MKSITKDEEVDLEVNDWDKPFSDEQIDAIEAILQSVDLQFTTPSPIKTHRSRCSTFDYDERPKTRRRLPTSISISTSNAGSFSCPTFRQASVKMKMKMKMEHPAMNFEGRIVYTRTVEEVKKATLQLQKLLQVKKQETGRCVLGLDIEWRPSFRRGVPQGKAAVMQICGDMRHCYVLHIIHSGIPQCLKSLLEDSTFIKVGVGIDNDAVKVFHDHNVSIGYVEDLSSLANEKFGGAPKRWSLSSLVETLTCKQLPKPNKIRLGNWETNFLSKAQLQYAATDAFASWYLYEVLKSFPDPSNKQE